MATMIETREQLASELSGATDLLGEIVTWDLRATEVALQDLRHALAQAGLDPALATDLRASAAIRRAFRELKENRQIDQLERGKGYLIFQFTKKAFDGFEGRLTFDFECKLTLNTDTGRVSCPDSLQLETKAQELFDRAVGTRNASDVSRVIQRAFESAGDLFAINPKKGVAYFVPDRFRDFTGKVEQFLGYVGGKLWRFPVPSGTEAGNASVRDAVEAGLASMLSELESAATDWDEKTRASTMDKALEKWSVIKHKAQSYAEYLGVAQGRLAKELERVQGELRNRISEVMAVKETK